MKTERRWLASVIAAAAKPQPALPWERGQRRRPAALAALTPAPAPRAEAGSPRGALAAR